MVITHDIIIIGSGIVGAAAALALARQSSLRILLLDAKALSSSSSLRVSALSLASAEFFQRLNVWSLIQTKGVSPYYKMYVWSEQDSGEIHFDCEEVQKPALGYIVEDQVIRESLHEALREFSQVSILAPVTLTALTQDATGITVVTEDQKIFSAQLVIAADGADSWVREEVGIEIITRDYEQTALVTTVTTTHSHENVARQRFLNDGPLAFLPLREEKQSSIVWSLPHEKARDLLALTDSEFQEALGIAFDHALGKILHVTPRLSFPLKMRHAKHYVQPRLALLGDAAHTLHPLVGQGVNVALLDVSCLVDVILSAHNKQRDFASFATLRRYERWRKSENALMLKIINAIKDLFASEKKWVQTARAIGLKWLDRRAFLKQYIVNYALGKSYLDSD